MEPLFLQISHDILANAGEDSYALRSNEQGAFWCVADGCGGLGSRRYEALGNHTGAFVASRLAVRTFISWASENNSRFSCSEESETFGEVLGIELHEKLKRFAQQNCQQEKNRITGSMQRTLPTTFCAAALVQDKASFWWAGDSRGYVLDEEGLHQYTRDDVRGTLDAFEMLYRDMPLSNFLSADRAAVMHSRSVQLKRPCLVITATDGVYSYLPTPMEMEMLFLDTLRNARSMDDWQKRLNKQIGMNAQDDATLVAAVCGFNCFEQLKACLLQRREKLQSNMITPVRRKKGNLDFARQKWQLYRESYDRTEDDHV